MQFQNHMLRHELKYYIHTHSYLSLRQRLRSYLKMDSYSRNDDGYGIRSLYFDGPDQHSLYDKNDGIFHRDKYRIRIYNGSKDKITLERKSKFGDYINKESAPLTILEYEMILNGDYSCLADKHEPLLREFYIALAHRSFRPAVIVDYEREAYIYEPGNIRITFDKRLQAGINEVDLFHPNLAMKETFVTPVTIMEVKYDAYLPDVIRQLVQLEQHTRSAISKYVICREVGIKHYKE